MAASLYDTRFDLGRVIGCLLRPMVEQRVGLSLWAGVEARDGIETHAHRAA
jgi:hypothetical protein